MFEVSHFIKRYTKIDHVMWAKLPWDCKFVISNDVCDFALLKNTQGSESMGVMKISIEMTTILDHSGVVWLPGK